MRPSPRDPWRPVSRTASRRRCRARRPRGPLRARRRSTGARPPAASRSAPARGRSRRRTAAARAGRGGAPSRARARADRRSRAGGAGAFGEMPLPFEDTRPLTPRGSVQAPQPEARERAEQHCETEEVRERDGESRGGLVDGRVERLEGGLEGEDERDRGDRVVETAGDRPRGDEREEGEGQREQEGKQRGGAHLAGERADRDAERTEGEGAEGERRQPEGDARPVEADERADAGEHREGEQERAGRGEERLLGQQSLPRYEAAQKTGKRVLFALERDAAGGEEHADEHQRDADGDDDGERVEGRAAAVEERAVDGDRLADGREDGLREGKILGGEGGEDERPFQRGAVRAGWLAGDHPAQQRRDLAEPDEIGGCSEHAEVAALEQQSDCLGGGLLDLFGEAEVLSLIHISEPTRQAEIS